MSVTATYDRVAFFECQACKRLWAIRVGLQYTPGGRMPVSLGNTHFATRPKSWVMCFTVPVEVNRPELHATYLLGGREAIEGLNGEGP